MAKIKIVERIAFPALWEAQAFGDGEPAFGARFPIQPNGPNHKAIEAAIIEAAKEKWPGLDKNNKPAYIGILKKLEEDGKISFVKKEYSNKNGDVYEGFEDMFYLNTKSKDAPTVIDRDKTPLMKGSSRPYSGCNVVASIELWAQDSPKWGRRINAQLRGVQFHSDGTAFGGARPASPDEFDDLSDGVDADDEGGDLT